MAEMHVLGSKFDRKFRQELNENFGNLSDSLTHAVDIVAKEAFDLVVDSAKIEWLSPVDTFSELDTTYPDATEGKTAMVRAKYLKIFTMSQYRKAPTKASFFMRKNRRRPSSGVFFACLKGGESQYGGTNGTRAKRKNRRHTRMARAD